MATSPTFDQALCHLRVQGIEVKCGPVDEDGIRCELLAHVLNDLQITKLLEYGRLDPQGIQDFCNSIEIEAYRRKALPLPADSVGALI